MITRAIMAITNNCIKKEGTVSDNSAKGLVEIIAYISPKLNNYFS